MITASDGRTDLPASLLDRVELVYAAVEHREALSLSQIARLTGLPNSSAHRLLQKMVELNWLTHSERGYELGIRLFELGTTGRRGHWFHRLAMPPLTELHRRTGLVVHLCFLDGADAVYWDKIASNSAVRVPTRVGGRYPAYRCAVGKAMLSGLLPEDLDSVTFDAMRATLGPKRERSIRAELAAAADDHVAYDRSDGIPGLGCVAAPIDYELPAPAAISVCGPLEKVANDRRLVVAVQQAAAQIVDGVRQHDRATV